jgi:hypothetical protein
MSRTDLDTWEDRQAKKQHKKKNSGETGQQGIDFVTKLGAAKHALTLVEKMPDIIDLIDNADAVRAAARSLHISAPGVNAWTRFVIDAERKGWERIEAMRKTGELAPGGKGGDRKSSKIPVLDSLIEIRPTQRASEWSLLSKLTEFQLDELERIANEEDRLLTRTEVLKLAKNSLPEVSVEKPQKERSIEETRAIERAQDIAAGEGFIGDTIQIADDAKVNKAEKGWWVAAFVFVEDELTRSDIDQP